MAENKVSLYKCLYGMELFKRQFTSNEALRNCMINAVTVYHERHSKGETVGIIDFNKIMLDLVTGDISEITPVSLDSAIRSVDILKFLPPEVINGNTVFGETQDRYCLALLLFAIKYFSHPFDGKNVYAEPIITVEAAKKAYGTPVFVFDVIDSSNAVSNQTNSKMIQKWESEPDTRLKDLFIMCFTVGVNNINMRPNDKAWLDILGVKEQALENNRHYVLFFETDRRRIRLEDGVEIFENDLYENGTSDKKVAVVLKSKKSDDILALGNASDDTWSVYMPDSKEIMVAPKGVAPLVKGATVSIGESLVNITAEER